MFINVFFKIVRFVLFVDEIIWLVWNNIGFDLMVLYILFDNIDSVVFVLINKFVLILCMGVFIYMLVLGLFWWILIWVYLDLMFLNEFCIGCFLL